MKIFRILLSLCVSLVIAGLAASAVLAINVNPVLAGAAVLGAQFTYSAVKHFNPQAFQFNVPEGTYVCAIQQEFWVNYIIESLFKENEFMSKSFDESDNVLNGSVVHIPQAGVASTVVKNRSSFPATAVRRTDTDISYTLDIYSTDPRHITNAEEKEISYDKMGSAIGEDISALNESYAEDLLYKWAPTVTTQILRTTGGLVATSLAPGATGTRKLFLKEDLKRAQALMNKQNIPKTERYALFPSDIYQELTADATLMARDGANGAELSMKDGVVLRLYGFNIMERSDTTIFTNAAPPVPKAPGTATAVTDNQAIICWQKNAVAKALGSTDFFENKKDALFFGDVYSMEVKMGGRKRRSDGKGVIAIVQEP